MKDRDIKRALKKGKADEILASSAPRFHKLEERIDWNSLPTPSIGHLAKKRSFAFAAVLPISACALAAASVAMIIALRQPTRSGFDELPANQRWWNESAISSPYGLYQSVDYSRLGQSGSSPLNSNLSLYCSKEPSNGCGIFVVPYVQEIIYFNLLGDEFASFSISDEAIDKNTGTLSAHIAKGAFSASMTISFIMDSESNEANQYRIVGMLVRFIESDSNPICSYRLEKI